jgi:ribosomal protein S18 acetylase RimI-like enzyme
LREKLISLLEEVNSEFEGSFIKFSVPNYVDKIQSKSNIISHYENNELLGFISFYINERESILFITMLCVKSEYRKIGLGTLLINYVKNYSKQNMYNFIDLEVDIKNSVACRFYKNLGFVEKELNFESGLFLRYNVL